MTSRRVGFTPTYLAGNKLPHTIRRHDEELVRLVQLVHNHFRLRRHADALDGVVPDGPRHRQPDHGHGRVQVHTRGQPFPGGRLDEPTARHDTRFLDGVVGLVVTAQVLGH